MGGFIRKDAEELARHAYFALPPEKRTSKNVMKALEGVLDPIPSKGTINRWAVDWRKEPDKIVATMLPPPPLDAKPEDLDDIPEAIRQALAPRLLYVGQGKGLEKVEDAVCKLAQAIGEKAPQIAEMLLDTETETEETATAEGGATSKKTVEKAKVARSAVSALSQLAQAMQIVVASRAMVSTAHRNYSEGDLYAAQAQQLNDAARAELARDITPGGRSVSPNGLSAQAEAMAALRGTVAVPVK